MMLKIGRGQDRQKECIPEVWSVMLPEIQAVGAEVANEGNKVVVFRQRDVLLRVFDKDRLVRGGSKLVSKHEGVFIRRFDPPPPQKKKNFLVPLCF